MVLQLNKKLDVKALVKPYAEWKRLQVADFLEVEAAEDLFQTLSADIPWGFAFIGTGGAQQIAHEAFGAMSQEEKTQIFQKIFAAAKDTYQYMYYNFRFKEEDQAFGNILAFLNSEPVLKFARTLTGLQDIVRCDAQATRYIGNCFLHSHMDQYEGGTRRAAYVLSLSKNWDPNWGGYLQFFKKDLNIEQAFKPDFNALNIFTVPQPHSVATVVPYCPSQRLSITGWFHAKGDE